MMIESFDEYRSCSRCLLSSSLQKSLSSKSFVGFRLVCHHHLHHFYFGSSCFVIRKSSNATTSSGDCRLNSVSIFFSNKVFLNKSNETSTGSNEFAVILPFQLDRFDKSFNSACTKTASSNTTVSNTLSDFLVNKTISIIQKA